ncbi:MAG TPA: MoaD/ThiS family protein [Mucilaginibacter sp.]
MKVNVLAFGIAKDIFGSSSVEVELPENGTTHNLKQLLEESYPRLKHLVSYMVAVNNEYASDTGLLTEMDEIAVIPPVSGG